MTHLQQHWDKVYSGSPEEKLGWYEAEQSLMKGLIDRIVRDKSLRILIAGAGSTTLVDELVRNGFSNIIATDISRVALDKLSSRVNSDAVTCIQADLTEKNALESIRPADLWIDRAVLHFFTEEWQRDNYTDLVHRKVKAGGYALFAEYNLDGAQRCAGLPVYRYSADMLKTMLHGFDPVFNFNHIFTMPSGDKRPYVYALFKKR